MTETGGYTVFTFVCLCVCVHSVQSPEQCGSSYELKAIKLCKSCKKFTWRIYALSERLLVTDKKLLYAPLLDRPLRVDMIRCRCSCRQSHEDHLVTQHRRPNPRRPTLCVWGLQVDRTVLRDVVRVCRVHSVNNISVFQLPLVRSIWFDQ